MYKSLLFLALLFFFLPQTVSAQKAALTNGKITSLENTTLILTKEESAYTITTDRATKFRRLFWGTSELSELSVGDSVNVIGTWTDDTKSTLKASLVRNLSIQKRNGVFIGEIKSINGSTWTVATKNRDTQTISVDTSTKYTDRTSQPLRQSQVLVGHTIRFRGLWNTIQNTITEVTTVKNLTLPLKPTPTP